ncbi:MAG: polysaccharide biosynthesis protein [Oscillospiraceae bacterium]|nr:polysaccharide biosynthesis protein [Oscillospiraceae bacterium]
MGRISRKIAKWLHLEHWQLIRIYLIVYDVVMVNGAYLLALWLRFDFRVSSISPDYMSAWKFFAPIYTVLCLLVFWRLSLYKSIWRFASFSELTRVAASSAVTAVLHAVLITVLFHRMPVSYYILGALLQFCFVLGIRFSYRLFNTLRSHLRTAEAGHRVMLIGAGQAGQIILREMLGAEGAEDKVVCIIDDNSNKWGRTVEGVTVVGGREDILTSVEKYRVDKIYLAIPSASRQEQRDILNICKETRCELKTLPGIYQLISGEVSLADMKKVEIADLLGREQIKVDVEGILESLRGKTILVTGGGGSIGSELCRQIARHEPGLLIIFDIYENNAYEIEQELKSELPGLRFVVEIGSVRDSRRVNQIFDKYRPDYVYHAAAHKHVPLMETSPCEALKNNVFGTYKTAYAAMTHGCRRFVLVSTDKAVHPTNIMGVSKRLCEMVIQSFDRKIREGKEGEIPRLQTHGEDAVFPARSEDVRTEERARTEFVAVRFGNVLGSNGSVVPLFKKMIARGGPVEVTHKDVIRYFMTVQEAVSLILQAGVYAKGGEIFVLDMGEPVKIDTLARNLIKLSGFVPDVDIKIVYTGLRPGEKLYEEKLMAEEGLQTTPNKLIHIGHPIAFDEDEFFGRLPELLELAYNNREEARSVAELMIREEPAEDSGARPD